MGDSLSSYHGDLLAKDAEKIISENNVVAIDTETTGLKATEDQLSLIQIAAGNSYYFIKYDPLIAPVNFIRIMESKKIKKVFHHAPFDLAFLLHHLKIRDVQNVVCTKIAYKLLNGPNIKSSLKDLIQIYFNFSLDKSQRLSNWNKSELDNEQIQYALNDVRFLCELWGILELELKNKDLLILAVSCFEFLPIQARLNNSGFNNIYQY